MTVVRILLTFSLALCLLVPATAFTVIGQDASSVPAGPVLMEWLSRFGPDPESTSGSFEAVPLSAEELRQRLRAISHGFSAPLPALRTPSGFSGVMEVDVPILTPVCVVGSDPVSRRWLVRNRDQLLSLGAHCVLVDSDERSLKSLRKAFAPLPVDPMPFEELAAIHRILTVPVLLTGRRSGQ